LLFLRLLRGACPEHLEILRYAQNDRRRRARNDTPSVIARSGNDEAIPSDCHALAPSRRSGFQLTAMTGKKRAGNDKGKAQNDRERRIHSQGGKGGIKVVRAWQLGQK